MRKKSRSWTATATARASPPEASFSRASTPRSRGRIRSGKSSRAARERQVPVPSLNEAGAQIHAVLRDEPAAAGNVQVAV